MSIELPDMLISDIGLPRSTATSSMRRIRALPSLERRGLPAIALTAFAWPGRDRHGPSCW